MRTQENPSLKRVQSHLNIKGKMPFESSCTERRVKRKYVNKEASLFNFQIRKIGFFSLVESECLHLSINLACLFVCLYPINVKTAEPIGPKFFVGHRVTTGKVYE